MEWIKSGQFTCSSASLEGLKGIMFGRAQIEGRNVHAAGLDFELP